MIGTLTINFAGVSAEVEVSYHKGWGGSWWEPPEPEELEVLSVTVGDKDASWLLDSDLSEEVEMACWDVIESMKRDD